MYVALSGLHVLYFFPERSKISSLPPNRLTLKIGQPVSPHIVLCLAGSRMYPVHTTVVFKCSHLKASNRAKGPGKQSPELSLVRNRMLDEGSVWLEGSTLFTMQRALLPCGS